MQGEESSSANSQIIRSYEEGNMSPEDIAASLDWDLAVVKSVLTIYSQKYRAALVANQEEDITKEEYKAILTRYKQLAMYSEVDAVSERACKNLIDEYKGRRTKTFLEPGNRINIVQINNNIKAAKEEMNRILGIDSPKEVLEIEAGLNEH